MVFDINKYPDKFVMNCATEDEAVEFLSLLNSIGKTWSDGGKYGGTQHWNLYREKTCYNFNKGQYSPVNYYIAKGYKILRWSDFSVGNKSKTDFYKRCKRCLHICECCQNQSECNTCKPFGSSFEIHVVLFCKLSNAEKYSV